MKLIKICIIIFLLCSCSREPSLTVAHIADAHINFDPTGWHEFVSMPPQADIVLDSGDFCDEFTPEMVAEFDRGSFFKLGIPRLYAYGNHEIFCNPYPDMEKQFPRMYRIRGYTILALPWWQDNPAENIAWLKQMLVRHDGPIIIVTHCPLLFRNEQMSHFIASYNQPCKDTPADYAKLRTMIEQSGRVRAVLSGHTHQNFMAIEQGVLYVSTVDLKYGHRIITFTEDSIICKFVPSKNADYKSSASFLFPSPFNGETHVLGLPLDRNFKIQSQK